MASYENKDGKRVLKSRTKVPPIARDATERTPRPKPSNKPAVVKESK